MSIELSEPRLTDLIAECRECDWSLTLSEAAASTIMEAAREHCRHRGHKVAYSRTTVRVYRTKAW